MTAAELCHAPIVEAFAQKSSLFIFQSIIHKKVGRQFKTAIAVNEFKNCDGYQ